MKTEIIKIKGDWQEVVNDCRAYEKMVEHFPDMASTDIQKRYDAYNKFYYGEW